MRPFPWEAAFNSRSARPYLASPRLESLRHLQQPPPICLSARLLTHRFCLHRPQPTMPYNTRRKSLSLPSLGIHIPVSHAARAAAASRNAARPSTSSSSSSVSASRDDSGESHPSKRHKRSHGGSTVSDAIAIDQTPPPSPTVASVDMTTTESSPSIDLDGINDDIVEAVIVQLQSTANRPHLVKELATVLTQHLSSVQQ